MHDDAISREKIRCGAYFIKNEKKKIYLICAMKKPCLLCIGFVRENSKLNLLLEIVESLGAEEVIHLKSDQVESWENCHSYYENLLKQI